MQVAADKMLQHHHRRPRYAAGRKPAPTALPPPPPLKSLEGWILFVTRLHEETGEEDIKEAFGEFGDIRNISLNLDRRTGFVKGYALVEYENYANAVMAKEGMDNADLLGSAVRVDWCFVKRDGSID